MNTAIKKNKKEKGQGLVEYALILVLVSIVTIGALTYLGDEICSTMDLVANALNGATETRCTATSYQPAGSTGYSSFQPGNLALTSDAAIADFCSQVTPVTHQEVGGVNIINYTYFEENGTLVPYPVTGYDINGVEIVDKVNPVVDIHEPSPSNYNLYKITNSNSDTPSYMASADVIPNGTDPNTNESIVFANKNNCP